MPPPALRWAAPVYALVLTGLALAPLARPGYLLLRDAVSTPRSYLSDSALGLGEAAPRAVPQDFAVALGSHLVDGGVLVKVLLAAGLWLAGCGAARLVTTVLPEAGLSGQLVAVTLAIWNPYVAERLLQGHWSLLVGYGCLPWVAAAMLALRSGAGWPALFGVVFWLALAGLTPTGAVLAAVVALACALAAGSGWPRRWCLAVTVAAAAVAALPWLTAFALGSSSARIDAPGVAAFAARAEPGLGTLGSLAGLGGIWNAAAVPGSRTTPFALLATIVLVAVVAVGFPVVARRAVAVPLLVLAATTVLVCAALATAPGQSLLRGLIDVAPGLGMLRDGQKWVALALPGYVLAGGGAVVCLRRRVHPAAAALACCVALIATLPDLAFGAWGRVAPVHYPPGWSAVAASINADPGPVAVLPADSMRHFAWAGAPVLDPLPRWVRADVLSTGDLTIAGHIVPGEGARARAVQELLLTGADPGALGRAGVGWAVVESGSDGEMGSAERSLAQLPLVYHDGELALYRVGGDVPGVSAARRRVVVVAHLAWLGLLAAGAAAMVVSGWQAVRRRR